MDDGGQVASVGLDPLGEKRSVCSGMSRGSVEGEGEGKREREMVEGEIDVDNLQRIQMSAEEDRQVLRKLDRVGDSGYRLVGPDCLGDMLIALGHYAAHDDRIHLAIYRQERYEVGVL
jgi:hypothetical protein